MKWNRGRQKDSYKINLSVTDCYDILLRFTKKKKIPKRFENTLLNIINDYCKMNEVFEKKHGRRFNSNIPIASSKFQAPSGKPQARLDNA